MKVQPRLSMSIALGLLVAPSIARQNPVLIWNASPSVPIGLYLIMRGAPRVGDLAVLRLPPVVALFADRRGYLPISAYLLKPVTALAGDLVCRFGMDVFVRGELAASALTVDTSGKPMPVWQGCRILQAGEVWPSMRRASTAATSVPSKWPPS